MKERGMLFNGLMVQALLDGRKRQTRRTMKVQPDNLNYGLSVVTEAKKKSDIGKYFWSVSDATGHKKRSKLFTCPFGVVGDRLWVRETFHIGADGVTYQADGDWIKSMRENGAFGCDDKWTPSMHMPRTATRMLLEITEVRAERLQSISEQDAAQEGLIKLPATGRFALFEGAQYHGGADHSARTVFSWLWSDIYGEDSWKSNPFVWVVKFKRVEV